MYLNGDNFHEASIVRLRANYEFSSMRTVYRWLKRYNNDGTVLPNRPTGNRHSTREVNGGDLINLATFRLVRPKAYIDEVHAYVHNRNPQNPPYSSSQIVRAEQRLEYVHGSNGVDLLMAISVEYVFNTIQTMLQMDPEGVDDVHGLVNKINGIIGDMTNFKPYFIHVLFPNN